MKKYLLIPVIVAIFLFALSETPLFAQEVTELPDPTGNVGGIPLASYHDDYWSYSGQLLDALGFEGYDGATGTGGLDLLIYTGANGANNIDVGADGSYTFVDPLDAPGGNATEFVSNNIWGLGNTVAVSDVLGYLQTFDPDNSIPVFTFDLNQTGASPDLWVSGEVRIVDGDGNAIAWWDFDNTFNNQLDENDPVLAYGVLPLPSPYDLNVSKGSGKLDYIAYAPTMDLSNPAWQDYYFEAEFNLSGLTDGFEELYLTGAFAPGRNPVPEPATMVLLGTGLLGFGLVKRKKK